MPLRNCEGLVAGTESRKALAIYPLPIPSGGTAGGKA